MGQAVLVALAVAVSTVAHADTGSGDAAGQALARPASTCTGDLCLPGDPSFPQQFSFYNTGQTVASHAGLADADVDAVDAWNIARTGEAPVVVAVVDSGIDYNNPDLAGHLWTNPGETGKDARGADKSTNGVDDDHNGYVDDWRGWDVVGHLLAAVDPDNDPRDLRGHGTHVSGTIAALTDNGRGVAGIAANARLMNVRVQGAGAVTTDADLAEGLAYAGANHARIANVSLAQDAPSELLTAAVKRYPGTLYVVAAGNLGLDLDKPGNQVYPCEIPAANVICVGATDNRDVMAAFSNRGRTAVDLAAPGTPVISTQPANQNLRVQSFNGDPFTGSTPSFTRGAAPGSTNSWAWSHAAGHSGSTSITDSPDGPYAGPGNTWVQTTDPVDLSGREGCAVEPWVRDDLAPSDAMYVQASTDGQFDSSDPQHSPQTVAWFSGADGPSPGTLRRVDLIEYDGSPTVYRRFGLIANQPNSDGHDGVYIDDMTVFCLSDAYSGNGQKELTYDAGTSMATPHVSAVAALILGRHPHWTPAQVKQTILRSVDVKPQLVGLTLTGGRVNAYKAVAESSAFVRRHVLTFRAGAGETNDVVLTRGKTGGKGGSYVISDHFGTATNGLQSGSRIQPGAGCKRVSDTKVRCAGAKVKRARIALGDLTNTLATKRVKVHVAVTGRRVTRR